MKAILIYLIQVIISSGILYSYYHFFLRNNKIHRYNRFYLLSVVVLSLCIPFLQLPLYFKIGGTGSSFFYNALKAISVSEGENIIVNASYASGLKSPALQFLLFIFYLTIVLFLLARFVFALFKIYRLQKKYSKEEISGIQIINTTETGTPFSFFYQLFWNKKIDLNSENGQYIFRHEYFHIKQRHSCDIIFMEFISIFLWINPFFYLVKKELKAIHEFLADQFATYETSHWKYAELLLMQVFDTKHSLVNPFFHNQIKRRIAMITSPKNTQFETIRKITGALLTFFLCLLFSCQVKKEKEALFEGTITVKDPAKPNSPGSTNTNNGQPISKDGNVIFEITEVPVSFRGGDEAWRKYLAQNVNPSVPVDNGAPEGTYTTIVQFLVDKDGNISDIKSLTNHGYGMEQEAIRIIKNGPTWVPANQNGHSVKAYRKQPLTFQITAE